MSVMSNEDRLVYMVNQIARNFAIGGDDAAAKATAHHIATFWDPRMKAQILARAAMPAHGLDAIGARAIALLERDAQKWAPVFRKKSRENQESRACCDSFLSHQALATDRVSAPQSAATEFTGGSDAG